MFELVGFTREGLAGAGVADHSTRLPRQSFAVEPFVKPLHLFEFDDTPLLESFD
jgi:hypothetical protein